MTTIDGMWLGVSTGIVSVPYSTLVPFDCLLYLMDMSVCVCVFEFSNMQYDNVSIHCEKVV